MLPLSSSVSPQMSDRRTLATLMAFWVAYSALFLFGVLRPSDVRLPLLHDIGVSFLAVGAAFAPIAAGVILLLKVSAGHFNGFWVSVFVGGLAWLLWLVVVAILGPSGPASWVWPETIPYLAAALSMSVSAYVAVRLGRAGG